MTETPAASDGSIEELSLPPRLRHALHALLSGTSDDFPTDLSDDEIAALVRHGIAPLVYSLARPAALRGEALHAAAVEPFREANLREVLALFASEGVTALLLKGTPLAYSLYDAPELRPRADTDLLIAREDLDRTRAALLRAGFAEPVTSGDEHGLRQAHFSRASSSGVTHHYDVHWEVTNTPVFSSVLSREALLPRAVAVPRLGPHAWALCDVDALLLACIHRVAHHHDDDRAIWLADIALLRARMSDAEHREFWELASRGRVVQVCARSIELAEALVARTSGQRAEDWLTGEELSREEETALFLDPRLNQGRLMVANLRALSWPARLVRLRQLAFPPVAFIDAMFGRKPRVLLPWLYARRAGRGVWRLFRRVGR